MDTNMVQIGAPTLGRPAVPNPAPKIAGQTETATPVKKSIQFETPKKMQVSFDEEKSDVVRYENMRRASEMLQGESFAVSDTRFAIYKDGSGQFVTRFTSLRDGSVTYFPEPQLMQYLGGSYAPAEALLNIDV